MKKVLKQEVLPDVWKILERRYGQLKLLSGQGVIRGERVQFLIDGTGARCVIKTSTGGRISFGKRDGKWSGLDESDFVVVVAPTAPDRADHMVSMFDQQTMREIFDENQSAQDKAGMGDLPNWVAPFHENGRGPRGVGDGFADRALWAEPLAPSPPASTSKPGSSVEVGSEAAKSKDVRALTIDEAKQGLAKTYGVSPAAIEISIRW